MEQFATCGASCVTTSVMAKYPNASVHKLNPVAADPAEYLEAVIQNSLSNRGQQRTSLMPALARMTL